MDTVRIQPATVHWALWGQDLRGAGYGVLAHSAGAIDGDNFEQVFGRYFLGTLDSLPQVAVGWIPETAAGENLITLAIHDKHVLTGPDAEGDAPSQIVQTRLFCVPYRDLAAGGVSYQAMYETLDKYEPPMMDSLPISVALPSTPSTSASALDPSVRRAAALLLTGKPVCVVGADQIGVDERLRFIDSVAWLLPYGLRSRLSASTWVSGLVSEHKLRLYFSSSGQSDHRHHVVMWNSSDDAPIDDDMAAGYLRMLSSGDVRPARLAEFTEPIDFKEDDIGKVMMYVTGLAGVDAVLRSCAAGLDANPGRLRADTDLLRRRVGDPRTPEQRRSYADLIKQLRLFRPSPRVGVDLLAAFYEVLLRLAFDLPLSYPSYCDIEESTGLAAETPLPEPLLRAMRRVGLKGPPDLLVSMAIGENELRDTLRSRDVPADIIVSIAAAKGLLPRHAKVICQIIADHLVSEPGSQDRRALRTALSQHGYLAPMLASRFPDEQSTQVSLLSGMLRAAYGRKLTSREAAEVLETAHGKPTAALLAATVIETDRRDVPRMAGQVSAKFTDAPSDAPSDVASHAPSETPGFGVADTGEADPLRDDFQSRPMPRTPASSTKATIHTLSLFVGIFLIILIAIVIISAYEILK